MAAPIARPGLLWIQKRACAPACFSGSLVAAWHRVELEVTPDRRHSLSAQTDIPMISKCVVFVFSAIALGGCCISGNGCYYTPALGTPTVPGAPIAWDGLGSPPTDVADAPEVQPKKKSRPRREIIVGPLGDVAAAPNSRSHASESWAQQEAADQADEIKLKKQLRICSNCLPTPAREDAVDSMTRR
jgi:hypothetical protein